jgi:hypothetical protein
MQIVRQSRVTSRVTVVGSCRAADAIVCEMVQGVGFAVVFVFEELGFSQGCMAALLGFLFLSR